MIELTLITSDRKVWVAAHHVTSVGTNDLGNTWIEINGEDEAFSVHEPAASVAELVDDAL